MPELMCQVLAVPKEDVEVEKAIEAEKTIKKNGHSIMNRQERRAQRKQVGNMSKQEVQQRESVAEQEALKLAPPVTIRETIKTISGYSNTVHIRSGPEEVALTNNLAPAIDDIFELLFEEDETEDDREFHPSPAAAKKAVQLISQASSSLQGSFPRSVVFPTGEQGLRIHWTKGNREIRLLVPSTETARTLIYHEQDNEYKLEILNSVETLVHWLKWLMD